MKAREEIHAVLLALAGDTLLLPNAAVAEVLSLERLRSGKDARHWLAGTLPYQDRLLRVIRFDVLNGGVASGDTRRTRVAILHGISGRLPGGQYALICQGHPNLVTLNRDALRPEPRHTGDREDLILARVKIANTSAAIPNLEQVEIELAKLDERGAETGVA